MQWLYFVMLKREGDDSIVEYVYTCTHKLQKTTSINVIITIMVRLITHLFTFLLFIILLMNNHIIQKMADDIINQVNCIQYIS